MPIGPVGGVWSIPKETTATIIKTSARFDPAHCLTVKAVERVAIIHDATAARIKRLVLTKAEREVQRPAFSSASRHVRLEDISSYPCDLIQLGVLYSGLL